MFEDPRAVAFQAFAMFLSAFVAIFPHAFFRWASFGGDEPTVGKILVVRSLAAVVASGIAVQFPWRTLGF